MTISQICGRLARTNNMKRFGLQEIPSEETVRRNVAKRLAAAEGTAELVPEDVRATSAELSPEGVMAHSQMLLAVLESLRGMAPLALQDENVATWWALPDEPSWPVSKGRCWREDDGRLLVELDAEASVAWPYLQQHLPGNSMWSAVKGAKETMADDVSARLRLLDAIRDRVGRDIQRGGLGFPVGADLGAAQVTRSEVTAYYVFALFVQAATRALGRPYGAKAKDEFRSEAPDTLQLGGTPVVRSNDQALRQRAVEFFLKEQEQVAGWDEAEAFASAYRAAEAATEQVNRRLTRIGLMPSLPTGSTCDLCRE